MDVDSILHKYQKSYYSLPNSVKNFMGTLYGSIPLEIRFGKAFIIHKNILNNFLDSSTQYQLDFQYNKTVETLQFANDHIPYYQSIFKEYGFNVSNFKDFSDLEKLPILSKNIIQKELKNIYTDIMDEPIPYFTGGSSAKPMKMYAPLSVSRSKEKAYFNQTLREAGHSYREKAVSFSARGNASEKNEKYWEYQKVDNYLLVSVNHLTTEYIEKIVDEIKSWKPKTFYGFPSAISLFIASCRSMGIEKIEGISGIVLTSESVSWEDIDTIKSFFQATVISHYGHTERVISAYRIDREEYSFFNSYGLVQNIDNEIIGTSFDNFVMPYINYSTNDYMGEVIYYENTNIVKSTTSIQGRIQEFVVTKNNIVIPILSIGAGHFSEYEGVEKAQFYQDTPGKVTLRIQRKLDVVIDKQRMIKKMENQVQGKIDFSIEFVNNIESTVRKKRILCIQKLDISKYR